VAGLVAGAAVLAGSVAASAAARPQQERAGGVFGRTFTDPGITVTSTGTYLDWQVNSQQAQFALSELARINPATGAILASRRLDAGFSQAIGASGSLWVGVQVGYGEQLLRLNPATLAVTGRFRTPAECYTAGYSRDDVIATIDGMLWMECQNRLAEFQIPSGKLVRTVTLSGSPADESDAGVSAGGGVLIDSYLSASNGGLQRRNPVTGALIASSPQLLGPAPASFGGIVAGGVWIAQPTGMLGFIERYTVATMKPVAATAVGGPNYINALIADGHLWASGADLTRQHPVDYCANEITGREIRQLPISAIYDELLAVGPHDYYYYSGHLEKAPVPAACA
jgi:outer membrane protein assembly factor BamB